MVADIVVRLDGLPLAIELAAARVRTMTVEEVRRRLDDLFGLLRTRDRSAPERHRTLTAVIEWSWDLLDPDAQEAMARLSVFHDGFTRDTAVAVLGADGTDLVETLAEQSLVTVGEVDGSTRFRMLETVREFAADRLNRVGLREDAHHRQDAWAGDLVERAGSRLFGPDEIAAVGELGIEENNLADVVRRSLRDGDRELLARLLACLGALLDDHRQPPADLRHRRRGGGSAGRLGPARRAPRDRADRGLLARGAPQLDAAPVDRGAAGRPRPLGRAPAPVGARRLRDVRRRERPGATRST